MNGRWLYDVSQIARMLGQRADSLCAELLPAGLRDGHEYRIGSPAGEPGRSMGVRLTGDRAGVWCDFAAGTGGDALDLVAAILYEGDKVQAIRWAKGWLGIVDQDPEQARLARERIERQASAARARQDDDSAKRRGTAQRIWLGAEPKILDGPVDRYLIGRGIDLRRLARRPRTLRYSADCYNSDAKCGLPAMVAAVHGPDGDIIACHRTWLNCRPDGTVTKAELPRPKMVLGRFGGGSIRLARGASGLPIGKAPPGEHVILTEGIEDALSIALAIPQARVLAAISIANFASIALPKTVTQVTFAADNDPENSQAAEGLRRAVAAHQAAGRSVKIARPPEGVKDFNDYMQAVRRAAKRSQTHAS